MARSTGARSTGARTASARTQGERLQPSLLDRLTDDEPGQSEETYEKSTISDQQLREFVLRDILWLFNTANNDRKLNQYPEIASSVLNFGVRPFAGVSTAEILKDGPGVQEALRRAIETFEPRINGLSVNLEVGSSDEGLGFNLEISGELWGQPTTLIQLRTEFDLESGEVTVEDASR